MKKTKRLLSFFVALAIMISTMSGLAVIASAEDTVYFSDDFSSYTSTGLTGQTTTSQTATLGNLNLAVGARSSGGDGTSTLSIGTEGSNNYLAAISGNYATSSRGASFSFNSACGIPAFASIASGNVLVVGFDAYFYNSASSIQIFGLTSSTTTSNGSAVYDPYLSITNNSQLVTGQWLNIKLVVDNAKQTYLIVRNAEGKLLGVKSFTAVGTAIDKFAFYGGASRVYIDNLKVYQTQMPMSTLTVNVVDDSNAAVSGATVTVDNYSLTTDSTGKAQVTVPYGDYTVSASKLGYTSPASSTVTASSSATSVTMKLSTKSYTPIPTTITISGGQLVMTAPIKNASVSSAAFSAAVADQENIAISNATIEWSIVGADGLADDKVSISSSGVVTVKKGFTAASGNVETFTITAKATNANGSGTGTTTIQISDYLFYEPGINSASYGGEVATLYDGTKAIVIPTSAGTKTMTLPEEVPFEKGTAKRLTFSFFFGEKGYYTYDRHIILKDAAGTSLIGDIDITGPATTSGLGIGTGAVVGSGADWSSGVQWATYNANTWIPVVMDFVTYSDGTTKLTVQANNESTHEYTIASTVTGIASVSFYAAATMASRLIGFKNFVISNADTKPLAISGDTEFAKIYGKTVTRDYDYSATIIETGETFTWSLADESGNEKAYDGISINSEGVLSVTDAASAGTVYIKLVSSAGKTATYAVAVRDYAAMNTSKSSVNGNYAVEVGKSSVYSLTALVDEYGDDVLGSFKPVWSVSNTSLASIDSETGSLTALSPGVVSVIATVGNPGKTSNITYTVKVMDFYYVASVTGNSTTVDVSSLPQTGTYAVTVDGTTTEMTATNSSITVDTTGASKIEVSPIYKFDLNGSASGYIPISSTTTFTDSTGYGLSAAASTVTDGLYLNSATFNVALPDGLYDFTFTKAETGRATIYVNGYIVGARVDMSGYSSGYSDSSWENFSTPATYTAHDVKVSGGMAKVSVPGEKSYTLDKIVIQKKADFAQRKTHIWIGGDSTVATYYPSTLQSDYAGGTRRSGWGQILESLVTDDMIVDNFALAGDYASNWYAYTFPSVLANAQAGDYLLIQFGINDYTYSSKDKMLAALTSMIDECNAKGVIPVLLNPQQSIQKWTTGEYEVPNGSGLETYWQGIRDLAASKDVLFIDLSSLTAKFFATVGKTYTAQNYYLYVSSTGTQDDALHLSYQGAKRVAEIVATDIARQILEGATDAKGNTFAGIKLNGITTRSISYTNSSGNSDTLTFKTVAFDGASAVKDVSINSKYLVSRAVVQDNKTSVTVTNLTGSEQKVTLLVASYGTGNSLENVKFVEATVGTSGAVTIDGDAPSTSNYKVMLWSNVTGMVPITVAAN
ncbi:MAG: GDSL-type esterase/lipase family protein [Clostridia bacterium]|nr:GDSL-type esterase/lipase family protein [Clostridia bacterium]